MIIHYSYEFSYGLDNPLSTLPRYSVFWKTKRHKTKIRTHNIIGDRWLGLWFFIWCLCFISNVLCSIFIIFLFSFLLFFLCNNNIIIKYIIREVLNFWFFIHVEKHILIWFQSVLLDPNNVIRSPTICQCFIILYAIESNEMKI